MIFVQKLQLIGAFTEIVEMAWNSRLQNYCI